MDTLKPSGKYSCVYRKGNWRNSIFWTSCDAWTHKKCSGIKGRLVNIPDFKCHRSLGLTCPIDSRPVEHVSLGDQKLEAVESFVYLGDGITLNGGCEISPTGRICSVWESFVNYFPC